MATSVIVASVDVGYAMAVDDPDRDDVRQLVQLHREWSLQQTPPEFSFSVEPDAVAKAGITLFSARSHDGRLLGIGGLKELDAGHGEIKAMHTSAAARGRGVGSALLETLVGEARRRGYRRVSLETGTNDAFLPARTLYSSFGFRPIDAFGEYTTTDHNQCMTLELSDGAPPAG